MTWFRTYIRKNTFSPKTYAEPHLLYPTARNSTRFWHFPLNVIIYLCFLLSLFLLNVNLNWAVMKFQSHFHIHVCLYSTDLLLYDILCHIANNLLMKVLLKPLLVAIICELCLFPAIDKHAVWHMLFCGRGSLSNSYILFLTLEIRNISSWWSSM